MRKLLFLLMMLLGVPVLIVAIPIFVLSYVFNGYGRFMNWYSSTMANMLDPSKKTLPNRLDAIDYKNA